MVPTIPELRRHQCEALDAIRTSWSATTRPRAWVVLPPGAGKTRVGLEAALERRNAEPRSRTVVFAPNTAIQSQWIAEAEHQGLSASTDRNLTCDVTCLTYQSLAVFDAEADPSRTARERLHPRGIELLATLTAQDHLVLVLDECHHLLEVWGQLLVDLVAAIPTAHVLALTATPPESLSEAQSAVVNGLFGSISYRVSVPAVVKEGHLAPFDELVWLTTPTPAEQDWLSEESLRFAELTHLLTAPGFGTIGFYEWLTRRFVAPVPDVMSWGDLLAREPELSDAALRFCHAGLLDLPHGARLGEQHRHPPSAGDWVLLLGDWLLGHVAGSEAEADVRALAHVRAALPAVGHVWTRTGMRRGRSGVDRVLARSAAKPYAAATIAAAEHANLGDRVRLLVLCDHEQASATVPLTLTGVQEAAAGSGVLVLDTFLADPATAVLHSLLVTARTVAGSRETLTALVEFVARSSPDLAAKLRVTARADGLWDCSQGWTSRVWVRHVTAFFEAGHTRTLIGTRGLLGEGWNARGISSLIDLTTATTLTAVVQTRGRALRTDPQWPEKTATNWTVVCVSEEHPNGDTDWARLVRKHEGFHGVDPQGDVVDGVAHIHPDFSPYYPPPVSRFDELNVQMLAAAADREAIRAAWDVGGSYRDVVWPTVRVRSRGVEAPASAGRLTAGRPSFTASAERGMLHATPPSAPPGIHVVPGLALAVSAAATAVAATTSPWVMASVPVALGVGAASWREHGGAHRSVLQAWVREQLATTTRLPPLERVAAAVADALGAGGLTEVGAESVVVEITPAGEYRCLLEASTADAELFSVAFDEAIGPVGQPRYLVSLPMNAEVPATFGSIDTKVRSVRTAQQALAAARARDEAWFPVPQALGRNARLAGCYLTAWQDWVGPGDLQATSTPAGVGIMAVASGSDPFRAHTVIRRQWG